MYVEGDICFYFVNLDIKFILKVFKMKVISWFLFMAYCVDLFLGFRYNYIWIFLLGEENKIIVFRF